MDKRIGFIGLGNMGFPMAKNLLNKFGNLLVYNRSQQKCRELETDGAVIGKDVADLTQQVDIIFLSLPGPKEVLEIVLNENGILSSSHKGQIIVDLSTVSPTTNQMIVEKAQLLGVNYIDVPVSGGPQGAQNSSLSLMIGASEKEIDELGLKEYLKVIGSTFHYIGKRGGGSAIKIINNFMSFATQVINGEALLMADSLGISPETFYQVTTTSSGNNVILKAKMDKVLNDDLKPGFALDLTVKDLELARQLCQDQYIPNFTLNTVIQFYREAQRLGYGQSDSSSVIRVIRGLHEKGE